jgi:hypothetical protein
MPDIHHNHAFGIDFQSEIALPEMRAGAAGHEAPVVIRLAEAPCPPGLAEVQSSVHAGPQHFWMAVPGAGQILVAEGSTIIVELAAGATVENIRAYLLGSAIGALMHQRGLLPLHASAVEIGGRAVLFCGHSGAGKSSLAWHLTRRGHPLLSDDICAIDVSTGTPRLWPGLINLKLWRDGLYAAGETHAGLSQVLPDLDKYRLPSAALADFRSYAVDSIMMLARSEDDALSVAAVDSSERASALVSNTFRGQLVAPMGRQKTHFSQCIAMARAFRVFRLARPWDLSALNPTCLAIEAAVRTS